jgi:hypothetical protein
MLGVVSEKECQRRQEDHCAVKKLVNTHYRFKPTSK